MSIRCCPCAPPNAISAGRRVGSRAAPIVAPSACRPASTALSTGCALFTVACSGGGSVPARPSHSSLRAPCLLPSTPARLVPPPLIPGGVASSQKNDAHPSEYGDLTELRLSGIIL